MERLLWKTALWFSSASGGGRDKEAHRCGRGVRWVRWVRWVKGVRGVRWVRGVRGVRRGKGGDEELSKL
jgi:hypothetical protein